MNYTYRDSDHSVLVAKMCTPFNKHSRFTPRKQKATARHQPDLKTLKNKAVLTKWTNNVTGKLQTKPNYASDVNNICHDPHLPSPIFLPKLNKRVIIIFERMINSSTIVTIKLQSSYNQVKLLEKGAKLEYLQGVLKKTFFELSKTWFPHLWQMDQK